MRAIRTILMGFTLVGLIVIMSIGVVMAQDEATSQPPERKSVLSTNPILDMFTWWNLEWEYKVAQTSTIGLAASYVKFEQDDEGEEFSEERYMAGNFFYRYYPMGEALKGFFFGGRLGYYNVSAKVRNPAAGESDEEDGSFYGIGLDIGYSWLLGAPQRFSVSLGIGAVRLFGGDLDDVATTLPTIRLINIGVAF
jgi:hypothetical protein